MIETADKAVWFKEFGRHPDGLPVLINLARATIIHPGSRENITLIYFGTESEEQATYVAASYDEVFQLIMGHAPEQNLT